MFPPPGARVAKVECHTQQCVARSSGQGWRVFGEAVILQKSIPWATAKSSSPGALDNYRQDVQIRVGTFEWSILEMSLCPLVTFNTQPDHEGLYPASPVRTAMLGMGLCFDPGCPSQGRWEGDLEILMSEIH